jgi:hypothetical protein
LLYAVAVPVRWPLMSSKKSPRIYSALLSILEILYARLLRSRPFGLRAAETIIRRQHAGFRLCWRRGHTNAQRRRGRAACLFSRTLESLRKLDFSR